MLELVLFSKIYISLAIRENFEMHIDSNQPGQKQKQKKNKKKQNLEMALSFQFWETKDTVKCIWI